MHFEISEIHLEMEKFFRSFLIFIWSTVLHTKREYAEIFLWEQGDASVCALKANLDLSFFSGSVFPACCTFTMENSVQK